MSAHAVGVTTPPASRSALARSASRLRALPGSLVAGGALLAGFVLFGLLAPLVLGDPNKQDLNAAYARPGSPHHLLGADPLGRDVLAWVAGGVRVSLVVVVGVVALSALIGVVVGLVAGYAGGIVDATLMRIVDLQLAIPPILLFIAASAVISTTVLSLILLISAVMWVPYARLVRTQIQIERERSSVIAARLAGATRRRVLFAHLLPATSTLVLVLASLQAGFVVLWEAGLSFLGLGVQPPTTSLGYLIAQGREALGVAWWIIVIPGAVLALFVMSANLFGDGLRDYFGVDAELLEP